MATGDYCGINELKARLWPDNITPDGVDDNDLASIITAVSREIDLFTGTRFYTTAADETRYYTAQSAEYCNIDHAVSITSVATDANADRTYSWAWSATDYELYPYNTLYPYSRICKTPLGMYSFTTAPRGVRVVGRFGYSNSTNPSTTIAPIREACILQALKNFKATPFGVTGPTPDGVVGVIPGLHPDVKKTLMLYKVNLT